MLNKLSEKIGKNVLNTRKIARAKPPLNRTALP